MLDVITRRGLLGFIDGTVQAPPKTVTTSVNGPKGGNTTHEERENEEYVAWKRSDDLVRKWIMDRLKWYMWIQVGRFEIAGVDYFTAKELWEGIAGEEQDHRLFHYLELYKAEIKGDWETAEKFIRKEPDAVKARITVDSETALIVAVKRVGGKNFVEKLVQKMSPNDLAICDNGGRTALHMAAGFGNIEVAKLLVGKNRALPDMETHSEETALFYAAERGDRKMVEWLMEVTDPNKVLLGEQGFKNLYQLTHSQLYDIALKLLKCNPWLAYGKQEEEDLKFHALATLGGTPSSFKSGNNFNFLQEFIYSRMKIKKNIANNHNRGDIEAPLASNNSGATNGIIVKPIRVIRDKKLLHNQALDLLKFLCELAIDPGYYFKADRNFRLPLERASSMGIHEIVEEILRVYPYAIYLENKEKQSIFQQAIVFRQEKVFSLIYQHEESMALVLSKGDNSNNNALHLAGYAARPEQAYRRLNAALHMQSELQWFKEVERLILPKNREERNNDKKTPALVFSDAHKELVEKGEKWLKDTASSCPIIASIIATVAFAAALQVPGGNNNNGLPNLNQQTAFIIFGIFNGSALFSSIASLLLFLSVLSSRYAEEDFLVILPSKFILGLAWLILSILFTLTAFGAVLYLVFGENKVWIHIPAVVALGFILVSLRAFQFPLIVDMIKSTYGSDIFYKKGHRISNWLDIKKRL
ncbi:hypothetical protein Vadar_024525 [Vaccinium darrowii]|uniref:Uncharacterized protein n=1 Tax=Vaccinium darrowii TaxID=229202 RepID=A0ACB7Y1I7_9ERIC|nr:hypothetical protein Vadar_024525 [Vaccinium darrowii]